MSSAIISQTKSRPISKCSGWSGLSENTLAAYRRDLIDTQRVLAQAGVGSLEAADQADLLAVLSHRQRKLKPSQHRALAQHAETLPLLGAQQRIDIDPTQQIEHPKLGRVLPGALSMSQVEASRARRTSIVRWIA